MYAIVQTGGKQYKISPGETIDVESLPVAEGEQVRLDQVLMVSDGEKVSIGSPVIPGATVLATSMGNHKGEKVIIFRYKAKTRSRRKKGHRQLLTKLAIDNISISDKETEEGVTSSGS